MGVTPDPLPDDSDRDSTRTVEVSTLTIRSARDGDSHYVELFGELDLACADAVAREVARVEATGVGGIVLDLSGLQFMDASGVRLLLELDARSRRDGGRLGLLRGQPPVQQVLRLTGVEDRLPFLD